MTPERFDAFFGAHVPRRLGVAVSGGSDSLALLHLLHDWGRSALRAVTVDHRLRPNSASEALHVGRICEGLGIPHTTLEWQGWDGRGNLQAEARRNRYALISDWARGEGVQAVALGHTREDVAETFLMRLARSAGVDGLAAMQASFSRDGMTFLRPLLSRGREELRSGLSTRGVRWVEDPSNLDEDFERVRARKALAALGPLGIEPETLAEVARHMSMARDALGWASAGWAEAHARVVAGDVVLGRTAFGRLPAEIRRRILAGALSWVSSAEYPPRRAPVLELLAAVEGGSGENTTLHGCLVMLSAMTVRITREPDAVAELRGSTDAPWDGRWRLDGPHAEDLEIRALGEAVKDCPGWRETGLPRATLLASPAIWRGETLLAAPVAGMENGWSAETGDLGQFAAFLISH